MGPTTGLENLGKMVKPLLPYADVLMPTRGGLRNYIPPDADIPICLRVSGGTSILNETNLLHEGTTVSIQDAIGLNVAAVAYSILVGQPFERDTLLGMTEYIDEANRIARTTEFVELATTADFQTAFVENLPFGQ